MNGVGNVCCRVGGCCRGEVGVPVHGVCHTNERGMGVCVCLKVAIVWGVLGV